MRAAAVVSLWGEVEPCGFVFAVKLGDVCFDTFFFFLLLGENQTHKNNDRGKHTSELLNYLMTFYETNRTGLFSEVHTLGELFFSSSCFTFLFFLLRETREAERETTEDWFL